MIRTFYWVNHPNKSVIMIYMCTTILYITIFFVHHKTYERSNNIEIKPKTKNMDQFQIVCTPFRDCWNKVPVIVAHVARSLIYSHDAIIDSFPSPARTTCSLVHSNLTDRDGFSFLK